jgi:23S rRNA pseudouridine2605 synthase
VQITLREGRNRQVRRMLDAVGHPVRALRRVRMAGFALDGLLSGQFRVLLPGEVHALRKAAETRPKPKNTTRPKPSPSSASKKQGAASEEPRRAAAKPANRTRPASTTPPSARAGTARSSYQPPTTQRPTRPGDAQPRAAAKPRAGERPTASDNKTNHTPVQNPLAKRVAKRFEEKEAPKTARRGERPWGQKTRKRA